MFEGPTRGAHPRGPPAHPRGPSGWAHVGPKWVGPRGAQVGGPTWGPNGWALGPTYSGPPTWRQHHIWRLATYRVGGWWELSSLQRSFDMCGMISIGPGCGGMDACSLVVRWGVCKFARMVVRLLGCLLWLLLCSSVFACFLLCLCVCLAWFQCKEWQSRLSCRTPWRINMNSPPSVMASNWRQISGWLSLSNETYVFLHMQNSSAIPILRGSGACTPPKRSVACDRGWSERNSPQTDQSGEGSS